MLYDVFESFDHVFVDLAYSEVHVQNGIFAQDNPIGSWLFRHLVQKYEQETDCSASFISLSFCYCVVGKFYPCNFSVLMAVFVPEANSGLLHPDSFIKRVLQLQ